MIGYQMLKVVDRKDQWTLFDKVGKLIWKALWNFSNLITGQNSQ